MTWQPIETAPKTHGSQFLAYAMPRNGAEQTVYEVTSYADQWGEEIRLKDDYGSPKERDILPRLTHWMSLPTPPVTE